MTSTQERPSRPWWKRLLRVLGIVLFALLGIVVLLLAFLHTSAGQELLRKRIEARIAEDVNGTVKLGKLRVRLGGSLELGGLEIADSAGKPVIALDSLVVTPRWGALVGGHVALARVAVDGVRLDIEQDADGVSNLERLFKEKPPTKPKKPSKAREIAIAELQVRNVAVSLKKADKSELVVRGIELDASFSGIPKEKTLALDVSRLALSLVRSSPEGTRISVDGLETSLDANLTKGAGKVALGSLKARARLERPGRDPFSQDIALGGIDVEIHPGELGAVLKKLETGLALLESIEVSGGAEGQALAGDQRVAILGLHVDRQRVNALLGKELVASDLDVALRVSGPPGSLGVDADVTSKGGSLALDGTLDLSQLERPAYKLKLVGKDLASVRLVKSDKVPPIQAEKLELSVEGHGVKRHKIEAALRLELGATTVRGVRVDRVLLVGRLDKGVLSIKELAIDGLSQKIRGSGRYVLASKELEVKLELSGDLGRALAALRSAGVQVKSQIPPGAIVLADGRFQVVVSGKLDEGLTVRLPASEIRVAGGRVVLDGDVALVRGPADREGKRALGLETLNTDVRLDHVRLSSLASLRGKKLSGMDGTVSGRVEVRGTKRDPNAKLALAVHARRTDQPNAPGIRVEVKGRGSKQSLDVSLAAYKTRNGQEEVQPLASVEAKLPITTDGRRGIASGRDMKVRLEVPRRTIRELLELLPPEIASKVKLPPDTTLEARGEITGRSDAPAGEIHVEATSRALGILSGTRQRIALDTKIEPAGGARSQLTTTLRAWLDDKGEPLARTDAKVTFARSPFLPGAASELDWTLDAAIGPQKLEALPPPLGPKGVAGAVAVEAHLSGNRQDATGKIDLDLRNFKRATTGPIDADLVVSLGPERTEVALDGRIAGIDALKANAKLGVAGRGLIPRAREKRLGDPSLEGEIELVRHRLADWAALRPKLARFLGTAGGTVKLGGSVKEPTLDADIALLDVESVDGNPSEAHVRVKADADRVTAGLAVGEKKDAAPLAVLVTAKRPELLAFLRSKTGDATLDVELSARADRKSLRALVPKLTRDFPELDAKGTLDWDMKGAVRLASHDGQRKLADAALDGALVLDQAMIPIPSTTRRYHSVALRLEAERDGLRIEKLHLEESDREKKQRTLDVSGKLAWQNLRPERADLKISARNFLLYGSDLLGKPDAPRAVLTADIAVGSTLDRPRRRVDVTVHQLDLHSPERYEKAHWPEVSHTGDVIYLDEGKAKLGRFVVPESKLRPPAPPPPAADPAGGTDVHIRIPKPIRVQKQPFELVAHGELVARIRPGVPKPVVEGVLHVVDGNMSLAGRLHQVSKTEKSRIYFDREHPAGELDLYVRREPHPVVLRDVSKVSAAGDDVRLHLTGPLSKPVSKVTGVGNADLWDILPVHNAGRVKYATQPDMPATSTAQIPREYDVVLISYMVANLPHNAFLDRVSAWADPYDDRFAYGRIQHLEAERYSESGKTRIRAASRPPTMGQSSAELEADYLLLNAPRTKAGMGLTAGSRLGGGPSLFFEWSSED